MTDDPVARLKAGLDEDEATARAATDEQPYDEWDAAGDRTDDEAGRSNWAVVKIAVMDRQPAAKALAQHIARQDPARTLRRVAAYRDILARYRDCPARQEDPDYSTLDAIEQAREYEEFVLPALAEEWDTD